VPDDILSSYLPEMDRAVCLRTLNVLRSLVTDEHRQLVFFVGAGISANTGMPLVPDLLETLLMGALSKSAPDKTHSGASLRKAIKRASQLLGFEITLNGLWNSCPDAIKQLFQSLADFEQKWCFPNHAHTFLASWLTRGGAVLTTNYDRLIERAASNGIKDLLVRYAEADDPASFQHWREDLLLGKCLFKVHGSFAEPDSCLGALEQVGTKITGKRAELLAAIAEERPLCFIGWRGVDPDIPLLLTEVLSKKESVPVIWVHYEGKDRKQPKGLAQCLDGVPEPLRRIAGAFPLITDADRLCAEMGRWLGFGTDRTNNEQQRIAGQSPPIEHTLRQSLDICTHTYLARFVGTSLRHAREFEAAMDILEVAHTLAESPAELSAATQEMSLAFYAQGGDSNQQKARDLLKRAQVEIGRSQDIMMKLNTDFGQLSMKVTATRRKPWLLPQLPHLFKEYATDIAKFRAATYDEQNRRKLALHEALFYLYLGKLRLQLVSWVGPLARLLAYWVLKPFEIARRRIDDAGDIHIHSRIDVLSGRSLALARFGFCEEAWRDIPEIKRLCDILADTPRTKHFFEGQLPQLEQMCAPLSLET
jgi:hypothetical protein